MRRQWYAAVPHTGVILSALHLEDWCEGKWHKVAPAEAANKAEGLSGVGSVIINMQL